MSALLNIGELCHPYLRYGPSIFLSTPGQKGNLLPFITAPPLAFIGD
jgi:hypothetical protein